MESRSILPSVEPSTHGLGARARADLNVTLERRRRFYPQEMDRLTWKKVRFDEAIFNMEKIVATATPLES